MVRKQGQKNEAISKLPLNLLLHFSRFTPFTRDYFLRSGLLASKRSLKSSPHFTYLVALRHWNQVQLARALYHQLSTWLHIKNHKGKKSQECPQCLKLIHFLLHQMFHYCSVCLHCYLGFHQWAKKMWFSSVVSSSEVSKKKRHLENISTKKVKEFSPNTIINVLFLSVF